MEPTRYQILAMEFQKKWLTATGTIKEQRQAIDSLNEKITQLKREVYRMQDEHHTTTNGGIK